MQIGIVGLPASGKTTFLQTMTRTHLDEAAARQKQANVAMVKVPDARVDRLAEFFHPKRRVLTAIEFVDVVGLQLNDRQSTQFTSGFLANVRTNDALLHIVRLFDDPVYPHPEGSLNPERDIRLLEAEFILNDLGLIETRLERIKQQSSRSALNDQGKLEVAVLERCAAALNNEQPLRLLEFNEEELRIVRCFQFLSAKPLLVVLNCDEDHNKESETLLAQLREKFAGQGLAFDAFIGKVEMELAALEEADAAVFMEEYGIKESALVRIIGSAYKMLGLITFLTCGEDECRAWTIRRGLTAKEAAGAIHTDLSDRFIRAETVHFEDFVTHGSFAACKDKGLWRLEGKDYIVRDGDILCIRNSN
jgi:ribosome-binding ATPase